MMGCLTIKIKNLSWVQHWSILTFDVSTTKEFYMKEISSMDFPQHGEDFYFYGQTLESKYASLPRFQLTFAE
jgi:hypothetical protein